MTKQTQAIINWLLITILILSYSIIANAQTDYSIENYSVLYENPYNYTEESIFYNGRELTDIDLQTFEYMGFGFAKDENQVYFGDKIIDDKPSDAELILCNFSLLDETSPYGTSPNAGYVITSKKIYLVVIGNFKMFEFGLCEEDELGGIITCSDLDDPSKEGTIYPYVYMYPENGYGKVFYLSEIMDIEDPESFEYIGNHFSKGDNNIFLGTDRIEMSDVESFEFIQGTYSFDRYYWKDKNNFYLNENILEGIDINNYKLHDCGFLTDDDQVFWFNNELKYIDVNSFQYLGECYAKDEMQVYYGDKIIEGVDADSLYADEDRVCDNSCHKFDGTKVSEENNSSYFERTQISGDFWKDKAHVYYVGVKIEKSDIESFEVVSSKYAYAKDKNHVYHAAFIVKEADPLTAHMFSNFNLLVDNKNIFNGNSMIPGGDGSTLGYCSQLSSYHLCDKRQTYWKSSPVSRDSENFVVFNENYAKDSIRAYFRTAPISEVDTDTFETINKFMARDKNYIFGKDEILDLDINESEYLGGGLQIQIVEDNIPSYWFKNTREL